MRNRSQIGATAGNQSEQVVATVLMLVGAMVWGQIISTFCLVLATTDAVGTEFRQRMDDLNAFLRYAHRRCAPAPRSPLPPALPLRRPPRFASPQPILHGR